MKPVVLITGGTGLLALNWAVSIRDRFDVVLGFHQREIALSGTRGRLVDLTSAVLVEELLHNIKPQLVIHTAGLTSVEQCEADPALAYSTNVELAASIASACAKCALPLVHISTDHLFSGEERFVDETHQISPVNVYGKTKAEAEQRVLDEHPVGLILRTNFYGWGPRYRRSFSDTIIQSLRHGKSLTLFDDVFYTPILIENLVSASHELLDKKACGVFHLAGDERISKYEFGMRIAKRFGLDFQLIKKGSLASYQGLVKRPLDMSLSNEKVCRVLGKTLGSIDQQLETLYQQERNEFAQEIRKL